jgi:hypothetical protein
MFKNRMYLKILRFFTLSVVSFTILFPDSANSSGYYNLGAFWRSSGPASFPITGVKGGADITADQWFADTGNILNASWSDSTNETSYSVTIYQNDGTTVQCAQVNPTQDVTNYSFAISTDCVSTLTEGTSYKLKVTATNGSGTNAASNSLFTFTKDSVPPSINFTSNPTNPTNSTSAHFDFTVTDATSGVASTNCYLDNVLQGACTTSYDLTSLPDGNHAFKVVSTDNAGNSANATYNWNVNTLTITGATYFITQTGTAWSNGFTVAGGTGAANITYTLPTGPGGSSVSGNATYSPLVSYTPPGTIQYSFTLRATDSVSGNTKDFAFTLDAYAAGVCVWTGATNTIWTTTTNWIYCNGVAPLATDKVAIPAGPTNQPIIAANTTVDSFGLGPGGGTITVSAAKTLTITAVTNSIRSSVKFAGATTTCTTCVVVPTGDLYVVDNARVTLSKGISLNMSAFSKNLYIGDGTTGGTLASDGGSVENEKPTFGGGHKNQAIIFNGAAGNLAKLDVDGMKTSVTGGASKVFDFQNYYEVVKFDNLTTNDIFDTSGGGAFIAFSNCTNATVTDTAWTNMQFNIGVISGSTGYNIRADHASCSALPVITVSNKTGVTGGLGYGAAYEFDPYNKITWINTSSLACIWTGAVSTAWANSGNWSNCANGRGDIPDSLDEVVIDPVPVNQPVVSAITSVKRFGLSASGGGTITINAAITFYIVAATQSIQSDVKFKGATTTCTTCYVKPLDNAYVVNGAKLTLSKGLTYVTPYQKNLYIGDGTTGGTLTTDAGSVETEKPIFGNAHGQGNIILNGAAGNLAKLQIDGLRTGTTGYGNKVIDLQNYYDVLQLDNATFNNSGYVTGAGAAITLSNCTNGTVTDTSWTNILLMNQIDSTGFNIAASHASCSALPVITVSNSAGVTGGAGYGSDFESDPYNKITWSNSTSMTCIWTGATNTAWANSGNWSGCANGRGGYPSAIDEVIIDSAPVNQPVVSVLNTNVRRFALSAGGGGTITINAGINLGINDVTSTARSNVKIKGATTTCTNCNVTPMGHISITDGAKLTLSKGITIYMNYMKNLYVGDGVTGGTLASDAGSVEAEKPIFGNSHGLQTIIVNGASGNLAKVQIDGFKTAVTGGSNNVMDFQNYYEIVQLDNFTSNNLYIPSGGGAPFKFSNCTNATITDTIWSGLNFANTMAGGYNINATGTNCNSTYLPKIYLTNYSGVGAGPSKELDTNNRIYWLFQSPLYDTYEGSQSVAWTQSFAAAGGSGTYTYSIPTNPGGATIDAAGLLSFTPGTAGSFNFAIRVTDTVTSEVENYTFTFYAYATGTCLWTGGTSVAWATASNWSFCAGAAPLTTSKVAISANATFMPTVSVDTTVNSFDVGPGGGTITVNAGFSLIVTAATNTIRSNVKIQGSTLTCSTCKIKGSNTDIQITDNAVLTLLKGITIETGGTTKSILIGNGTTGGTLATGPASSNNAEWPLVNIGSPSSGVIILNGASGNLATVRFDGIRFDGNSYFSAFSMNFSNWYNIQQFDNVKYVYTVNGPASGKGFIKFTDCTNATITDTAWDGQLYDVPITTGGYNVVANGTNCSTLPVITISNAAGTTGGAGYGSQFELDPNNKINWINNSNFTCTWTGTTSTAWTDPTNWSGCGNSRGGYPDTLDYVVIPSAPINQPVISASTSIQGFGLGAGGGTITINNTKTLSLNDPTTTVRSDVKIQGNTTTCSNCAIRSTGGAFKITDDATLTLLKGISVYTANSGYSLYVGNGTTGGTLATGPAGPSTEWPQIYIQPSTAGQIVVNGASGHLAKLNLDGIQFNNNDYGTNDGIAFQDWYEVVKLDNTTFTPYNTGFGSGPEGGKAYIKLTSCTNATITDTTWANTTFSWQVKPDNTAGYNIRADGTNCSTLPVITISNTAGTTGGSGYGADWELDPNNKISWNNSTSYNCTWTGATSTAWTTTTNWSGCTNGRANYPDQLDTVVIPVTATQPVITANTIAGGFGTGTGGGTLTINASRSLYLMKYTSTVRSDVKLQGNTTTCTTCRISMWSDMSITDGATLTLLKGSSIQGVGNQSMSVGDGVTGGTLATGPAGLSTEWPTISMAAWSAFGAPALIRVNGASGQPAVVNFDGIKITGGNMSNIPSVKFDNYYQIAKFDNVTIQPSTLPNSATGAFITLASCTNGTFTDTIWDALTLTGVPTGVGKNIHADGTNCNSTYLPRTYLTNYSGTGALLTKESDPNNRLYWLFQSALLDTYEGSNGVAWSQSFAAAGGSGTYTYSIPTNPGGASINAAGLLSFTPGSAGSFNFVVRVTDTVNSWTEDHTFTFYAYATGTCLWTGGTSVAWATASNWSFCSGAAPLTTSKIAISANATFMPTVSVNTTVDSFDVGPGGGTVTVNAGSILTITAATNTIRSSVKFQGSPTTCNSCKVKGGNNIQITDNAVVTLLKGVTLETGGSVQSILVGNGTTGGTLATGPAGLSTEWPTINIYGSATGQVVMNGASGNLAILNLDGVKFKGSNYTNYGPAVAFTNWYEARKLDNVYIDGSAGPPQIGNAFFRFNDCTNATITDTTWSSFNFDSTINTGGYNVRADGTNCAGLTAITISNGAGVSGGSGYGSYFELDPNNKINWANDTGFTCTWNGSVSTSWTNSANWTGCGNSRGGYPDTLDYVIIPSGPALQPVIAASTAVQAFGLSGAGGGTVTINANVVLTLNKGTSTVRSDVKVQGATTTCTNCFLRSGGTFYITDDATLTLLKGITVTTYASGASFFVGDGVTGGTLATGPAGLSTEWPKISIYGNPGEVILNGSSGHLAKLNLDGLTIANTDYGLASGVHAVDWYEIQKFDNVTFTTYAGNSYPASGKAYIKFISCTNATITDTAWDNITFTTPVIPSSGYNVRADGTNCNTLPAVTISNTSGTNGGQGYGSDYELDPNGKINWSNSSSFVCTWTGATNSSWTNSGNWSSCGNSRGGYPDQLDAAIIPVTGTAPVVAASTAVKGFDPGTGGGTITINAAVNFFIMRTTSSIRSDIKFQGATTTCTNCKFMGMGNLAITDNATLTLLKGINLTAPMSGPSILVGDGVTGGTLATGPAGPSTEWPLINTYGAGTDLAQIAVRGVSGQPSIIRLDGVLFSSTPNTTSENIKFIDWYDVQQMDNLSFQSYSGSPPNLGHANIRFSSCTNGTVTDTTWASPVFTTAMGATGYNVRADGTNCNTLPTISITGATGPGACGVVGAGACAFENDPNVKIDWN